MSKVANEHLDNVQKVIDVLELHTITKPGQSSLKAVKEAYQALYQLRDFLENIKSCQGL